MIMEQEGGVGLHRSVDPQSNWAVVSNQAPQQDDEGMTDTAIQVYGPHRFSGELHSLLGQAFTSVRRSSRSAPALVTPIVLGLQFIAGVGIAFPDLPRWVQQIATAFPVTWTAQGMPAAQEITLSWEPGRAAPVLLAWSVIGLVLCLRMLRRQIRRQG
jgi:hypothetical protein